MIARSRLIAVIFATAGTLGSGVAADAQIVGWPSEDPPPPLLARDVKFPEYEIRRLGNGLQVVFVAAHEQPVVNLRLLVRDGASSDPPGKPGVAALATTLLDQGTTSRTAQEIAETIDNIGGAMAVGAGSDLSYVNVLVMKDSFDLALELLSDIARNPAYSPSEINRQRQQLMSGIQVSYEDPEYLADIAFGKLVYGLHPYGRPQNGTSESVQAITREDVLGFHGAHFVPNNAILAIVGDVTPQEAFDGASRVLGNWERGVLPTPGFVELPSPMRRLVIIDKPGAVQTSVRVGHLALSRADPDYLAFDVAVKILGGEGGNRLAGVLRTDRSLTYSASADIIARQFSGDFMAKTNTRSSATAEVLRLTIDEIARLRRERVGRRELRNAQDYLAGNFPLGIETPNAIAARVLEAMLYGLDLNDLETYPERIRAVTVDDIQRVARAYLRPSNLSIVLVGDASAFVGDLAGVGFDEYEIVSLSELDLASVDLRRPAPRFLR